MELILITTGFYDVSRKVNFTKKLKVTLGSKAEKQNSILDLLQRYSTIKWYIDGPKTPVGISAGIAGPSSLLYLNIAGSRST